MQWHSSIAGRTRCVSIVVAVLAGCVSPQAQPQPQAEARRDVVVPLTAVADSAPAQWRGLSNIFLDSLTGPSRDSVRMPAAWTGAALDDVFSNRDLESIRILRFRTEGDTTLQFAVDTVGDLDFTRAPVLRFATQGKTLVANIELTVRSRTGSQRRVPYQILRFADRYTYARIAEYRTGTLRIDDRPYAIQVYGKSRGAPFFAPNAGTVFLVDMNADGRFAETAALTVEGRPVAAELALAATPFELAGRLYEIVAIDSTGTALRIRPTSRTVAVASNRRAPEFRATSLTGGEFRLSKQRGKVVLISFWATDCIYSERVRGASNVLVPKYGAKFTWVAMAKETSRADIAAHLQKAPIDGVVTLADSAAWATYNPAGMTPVFVVVDAQGIVRFRAEGAQTMSAVAAKIDELLAAPR